MLPLPYGFDELPHPIGDNSFGVLPFLNGFDVLPLPCGDTNFSALHLPYGFDVLLLPYGDTSFAELLLFDFDVPTLTPIGANNYDVLLPTLLFP